MLYFADRKNLEQRASSFWMPWIPGVLNNPHFVAGKSDVDALLLQMAYAVAPDEVIRRVLQIVDMDNERLGHFLCGERIDAIWDSKVESALVIKTQEGSLKSQALRELLIFLFKKGVVPAREWAETKINPSYTDLDRVVAISSALLMGTTDGAWPTIWSLMESDIRFGRALLESTSYADPTHASFTQDFTEEQLGKLYLWILAQYPPTDSVGPHGFGMMAPKDTIRFLRDGLLEQLKRRATFAACDALASAIVRFPEYQWLRFHLDEAESLACASTWHALPVPKLLQVCVDSSKRLVESSAQLLDVVLESLDRLQTRLHGELPAVRDLWSSKGREYWPKDEEDISDYVARHFREDLVHRGVIVNREVQIRRAQPGEMPGQKTDIHIDANASGMGITGIYGPISLIVEVKGSWNAGLLEDMQRQLRDRYLQNNQCRTGLYLVAYFSARTWPQYDQRKSKSAALSVDELRNKLEEQAVSLSGAVNLNSYVLDASLDSTAAQL